MRLFVKGDIFEASRACEKRNIAGLIFEPIQSDLTRVTTDDAVTGDVDRVYAWFGENAVAAPITGFPVGTLLYFRD